MSLDSLHIPFSGRNPYFQDRVVAVKPHILLFSKADLADLGQQSFIEQFYRKNGVDRVLFADCSRQVDKVIKKQLIPAVSDVIESKPRYDRSNTLGFKLLIIGIPNVGKSSLINSMRRTHLGKGGKASPVGALSGVTRSVLGVIKVSANPPIQVMDSPGIMVPQITDPNVGMKLALCASLKDHLVGEYMIADYILYWFNKHNRFEYVEEFCLPGPTDDINEVLFWIARTHEYICKVKPIAKTSSVNTWAPNFQRAASHMIKVFRSGRLGKVNLDQSVIEELQNVDQCDNMTIALQLRAKEVID